MDYSYAIGSVKALEQDILDKNKLSKLINIDKKNFVKVLNEMGYGNNDIKSLEEVFAYQLSKVKKLLDEITPDKFHTDLFFFEYDCLNIKTLYKKKIFGINIELKSRESLLQYDDLIQMIINEYYANMEIKQSQFFIDLNSKLSEINSSRLVSSKIDSMFYQYVLKNNKNVILKKYFQLKIDIANLSTLVRSTNLNWEQERFEEMFIDGGLISKDVFIESFHSTNKEYNFRSYYNEKLSKILKNYEDTKNINVFEKQLDNYLLEFMSEFRNDSFDIGPIIYYFLKKDAEAKNIRYIYAFNDIQVSDLLDY